MLQKISTEIAKTTPQREKENPPPGFLIPRSFFLCLSFPPLPFFSLPKPPNENSTDRTLATVNFDGDGEFVVGYGLGWGELRGGGGNLNLLRVMESHHFAYGFFWFTIFAMMYPKAIFLVFLYFLLFTHLPFFPPIFSLSPLPPLTPTQILSHPSSQQPSRTKKSRRFIPTGILFNKSRLALKNNRGWGMDMGEGGRDVRLVVSITGFFILFSASPPPD